MEGRARRPREVTIVVIVLALCLVLGLANVFLGLARLVRLHPEMPPAMMRGLFVAIALRALPLLLLVGIWRGMSSARWVWVGWQALSMAGALSRHGVGVGNGAWIAIVVVTLLLFTPAANAWFRRRPEEAAEKSD